MACCKPAPKPNVSKAKSAMNKAHKGFKQNAKAAAKIKAKNDARLAALNPKRPTPVPPLPIVNRPVKAKPCKHCGKGKS